MAVKKAGESKVKKVVGGIIRRIMCSFSDTSMTTSAEKLISTP